MAPRLPMRLAKLNRSLKRAAFIGTQSSVDRAPDPRHTVSGTTFLDFLLA